VGHRHPQHCNIEDGRLLLLQSLVGFATYAGIDDISKSNVTANDQASGACIGNESNRGNFSCIFRARENFRNPFDAGGQKTAQIGLVQSHPESPNMVIRAVNRYEDCSRLHSHVVETYPFRLIFMSFPKMLHSLDLNKLAKSSIGDKLEIV